jgi:hypothetical protein
LRQTAAPEVLGEIRRVEAELGGSPTDTITQLDVYLVAFRIEVFFPSGRNSRSTKSVRFFCSSAYSSGI